LGTQVSLGGRCRTQPRQGEKASLGRRPALVFLASGRRGRFRKAVRYDLREGAVGEDGFVTVFQAITAHWRVTERLKKLALEPIGKYAPAWSNDASTHGGWREDHRDYSSMYAVRAPTKSGKMQNQIIWTTQTLRNPYTEGISKRNARKILTKKAKTNILVAETKGSGSRARGSHASLK